MIHSPANVRVYLCLTPCDMRKSFDSLHAMVREHLESDAFAGHLFVFASRRKDRVKIPYWLPSVVIIEMRFDEPMFRPPIDRLS